MRNNNYICHAPYLRNRTSSDHNFWYTYVKWWCLQAFFQAHKITQYDKSFCCTLYFRTIYHIVFIYGTHACIKEKYLQSFFYFIFFKIMIFRIIRRRGGGLKGKKWPKMAKHSVSLTLYLRNLTSYNCEFWYTCVKWWISSKFFHFSKFWFLEVLGG